jgi:hypothetical protein
MRTRLDGLLSFIDPEENIERTFNRANEAINTFRVRAARIEDWDEFRSCLVAFLRHVDVHTLRLRAPVGTEEFSWRRCAQILRAIYGSSGGEKAAFELARTGNEGGLGAVLRAFAMHMAEDYSRNEIAAKVSAYWNSLSVAEQLEAASEYLAKYGHLLPSELTEGSAARIRANFWRVLEEHPRLFQRLHRVGR